MIEVNKIYCGDALEILKTFPDQSISSVITSPPYWQLRDYGYPEQWGLEPTYQEYLEHLWSLMDEIYRILKSTGTAWINLGDTYASGSRAKDGKNHTTSKKSKEHHIEPYTKPNYQGLDKCLVLIPHRFAIGCIDRGWIMRNDIIWAKRNGMPESCQDRFSKKHEYIFFMTKSQKYYFDLNGIRNSPKKQSIERALRGISENNKWINVADGQVPHNLSQPRTKILKENAEMFGSPRARNHRKQIVGAPGRDKPSRYRNVEKPNNPFGANPGTVSDFWDIPTQPNSENHFAGFNFKLIEKPIIAGCPENGIVLDPFCGTGTTLIRALQLNRKIIGIDGSREYCNITRKGISKELNQTKMSYT